MKESKVIKEIYWLRALACLAVVVTHAVNTTLSNYEYSIGQYEEYLLIAFRFIAFFGTPVFIFISEFLLAHSYPNGVPKGFLIKRVKFLLAPFAFMGLVFAFITADTLQAFTRQLALNLFIGGYTGYFILIIFQFYLMHMIAQRFLERSSPVKVIGFSLVINVIYLGFFHMTSPPAMFLGEYIWERGHWLPVFGWLFYFTLGYYCGRHYHAVMEQLLQYRKIIYGLPFLSIGLVFFLVRYDILTVVSSKRIDYLLYTPALIAVILLLTYKLKRTPPLILSVSKYSFNIYLLHTVFLYYLPPLANVHPVLYFIMAVAFSIAASVLVVKLTSSAALSPYLIGKTLPIPRQQPSIRRNKIFQLNL
ncbi:acyltransferase family protein [Salipaludibacillus aurantiacus]|uniref:Membrane-bound acyltransferase YfiQ, involved in biofilm formation n=1 Tax=Salipaludibacillus aurantiacus TaxID=1601833 RepID=A0A1H9V0G5_9BACI|nr:acyltransferase family protein [Salipaludibacillus aurantiacus]SES15061.1 Membrane-bound acyltransferase YfiQ, involved in biofilm formation [Salipaludibacillus aurantiacus]